MIHLPEQNESKQKVYKENTDGRLLVGFSTFEKGACYVLGLPNEEKVRSAAAKKVSYSSELIRSKLSFSASDSFKSPVPLLSCDKFSFWVTSFAELIRAGRIIRCARPSTMAIALGPRWL